MRLSSSVTTQSTKLNLIDLKKSTHIRSKTNPPSNQSLKCLKPILQSITNVCVTLLSSASVFFFGHKFTSAHFGYYPVYFQVSGLSACTGTNCLLLFVRYCIFGLVLRLYYCRSLFLLFYVICPPVHTETTQVPGFSPVTDGAGRMYAWMKERGGYLASWP